jgi:hypothetical protein
MFPALGRQIPPHFSAQTLQGVSLTVEVWDDSSAPTCVIVFNYLLPASFSNWR